MLSHKNEEHNLEDATAIVIVKQNQSLRSNQILADPNLSRATQENTPEKVLLLSGMSKTLPRATWDIAIGGKPAIN